MFEAERGKFRGIHWVWAAIAAIVAAVVIFVVIYYSPVRSSGPLPAGLRLSPRSEILKPDGGLSLVGRNFELTGARVLNVVGTAGFWIGPIEPPQTGRESLKLFVRRNGAGTPVSPGQVVSLIGTVEKLPADAGAAWRTDPETASELSRRRVYLLASKIAPAI